MCIQTCCAGMNGHSESLSFGLLVYWGLTPQQQPGSYQGGDMMMKSVFWWRKPEYPEETTDLRQVTDAVGRWFPPGTPQAYGISYTVNSRQYYNRRA